MTLSLLPFWWTRQARRVSLLPFSWTTQARRVRAKRPGRLRRRLRNHKVSTTGNTRQAGRAALEKTNRRRGSIKTESPPRNNSKPPKDAPPRLLTSILALLDGFLKESPPNKPLLGFFSPPAAAGGERDGALDLRTSPKDGVEASPSPDGDEPLASRAADGTSVEEVWTETPPAATGGASSTAGS